MPSEFPQDFELCLGLGAVRADAILDCHLAMNVLAQWGLNQSARLADPPVNNGQVFLIYFSSLPKAPQASRGGRVFCQQSHAAGFAIEPVDELGMRIAAQLLARPADQAGKLIRLGRMTHQACRFINDQQLGGLVKNLKQLFHVFSESPMIAREGRLGQKTERIPKVAL